MKKIYTTLIIIAGMIIPGISSAQNTGSSRCADSMILTQDLTVGSYNNQYHPYTKSIVREADILQAHMNRLGFGPIKEDGKIGPKSEQAIKRMQRSFGLAKIDAKIGPNTREKLNNSCGTDGISSSDELSILIDVSGPYDENDQEALIKAQLDIFAEALSRSFIEMMVSILIQTQAEFIQNAPEDEYQKELMMSKKAIDELKRGGVFDDIFTTLDKGEITEKDVLEIFDILGEEFDEDFIDTEDYDEEDMEELLVILNIAQEKDLFDSRSDDYILDTLYELAQEELELSEKLRDGKINPEIYQEELYDLIEVSLNIFLGLMQEIQNQEKLDSLDGQEIKDMEKREADAAAKAYLSILRVESEISYSDNNDSYSQACRDSAEYVQEIEKQIDNNVDCYDNADAWVLEFKLNEDGAGYFCADSTGFIGGLDSSSRIKNSNPQCANN